MRDWPKRTIAECAADEPYSTQIGPFGKALTPDAYVPEGVPLLRGVNVNSGRFHDDDYVFINEADADRLSKFESFPGDVLLVHKGSLGQIGLMPERRRYARYIMGNSMLRVKCDLAKILPTYLRYWLQSPEGQHYLFSRVSQVGVPQIQRPLTTLREAALPVPPVPEQEAITSVLGALDEKIEQNQRTARALERLAQGIFRAWFVDFEPVKAKATGAAEFPSMPQHIFGGLPATFTNSEIGTIPEGWQVKSIGDAVTVKGGATPSTKNPEYWDAGKHCWATPKDLSRLTHPVLLGTERHITDAGVECISSGLLPKGTVLLSSRAPVGYLAIAAVPTAINQGFIAMVCNRSLPPSYVLNWTYQSLDAIKARASGTTFPEISKRNFRSLSIVEPPSAIVNAFASMVDPMFELLTGCVRENTHLAEMRDYLLPQLLSGRVRVEVANG